MIDLEALQKRFPHFKIRSQPAEGCKCNAGVRKTKDGHEFPCMCVCMSAPEPDEQEYRVEACAALGNAARNAGGAALGKRTTTK